MHIRPQRVRLGIFIHKKTNKINFVLTQHNVYSHYCGELKFVARDTAVVHCTIPICGKACSVAIMSQICNCRNIPYVKLKLVLLMVFMQLSSSTIVKSRSEIDLKIHGQVAASKKSWDNCEYTDFMASPPETIVCQGRNEHALSLVEHLSIATNASSEKCASICNCSSKCETCGIDAKPLPKYFRVGEQLVKRGGGRTNYLLLLVADSQGKDFLAKVGDNKDYKESLHRNKTKALQTIRAECGFEDIVPEERVGPLKAHLWGMPREQAFVAADNVCFSEYFEGVQARSFADLTSLKDILNSTQIVRAALHDFLIGVGDHCSSNILVLPNGNLKLMDNQCASLGSTVNGVFVPGTHQWFKHRHFCKLFDYRFHTASVGTNYPTSVTKCLNTIANLTIADLVETFHIGTTEDAFYLRERAQWMLSGFEYAILRNLRQYTWKDELLHKFTSMLSSTSRLPDKMFVPH